MEEMENVEYLGDGLYASYDGYQICLMANSHINPTDRVYLDPAVYSSLQKYVSRVVAQHPAPADGASDEYVFCECPSCHATGLPELFLRRR